MRDAALTIAALRDDFAPSLARRIATGFARLWAGLDRHRRARRHLARLRQLDAHMLDDLGLKPHDVAGLDPAISAPEAIRRLQAAATKRRCAWTCTPGWTEL